MSSDNETDTIEFLKNPAIYPSAHSVEIIETHISRIFLAGDRVFKMKRTVKLPYVDFSTPEFRLQACRKEVELNSVTAPGLYIGVRRITREPSGELALDGIGTLVDAVIEMKRFDQSALLDRMATARTLTPALLTQTARMIAQFHDVAPIKRIGSGAFNMEAVLDINRAGFSTSQVFEKAEVDAIDQAFRTTLARHAALLDRREKAGKVRRCHGDLHLRNICLFEGEPRLFDCIEFNEVIATIDVLYDLSFLLMDLWHRGLPELANLVMNRYLDEVNDEDGLPLLPFFMAVRAAVRAHVIATQAEGTGGAHNEMVKEARSYFSLARELLRERTVVLIAIGGLSGSGKSTIAQALAPSIGAPPGARIIESDRVRKALHGVAAETRLPDKAYQPKASLRVYREMARRAEYLLSRGTSVVANAVFDRPADRAGIEQATVKVSIAFQGFWLVADRDVLRHRVEQRVGGSSDATVDVLSRQLEREIGGMHWHRVDADRTPSEIVVDILARLSR